MISLLRLSEIMIYVHVSFKFYEYLVLALPLHHSIASFFLTQLSDVHEPGNEGITYICTEF